MLVACLTPTRDRRLYLPLAIQCFLNQTHTDRELLILDDGDDDIRDLIPKDRRITCVRNPAAHATLGAKLNALAAMTSAEVLCNWDDDDWYSLCWIAAPTPLPGGVFVLCSCSPGTAPPSFYGGCGGRTKRTFRFPAWLVGPQAY